MTRNSGSNDDARVALTGCREYDLRLVRSAVCSCFESLGSAADVFERGNKVLLKPNLLSPRYGPEYPINTHPAVIRAVAEVLRFDFNCRLAIGDSCGSLASGSTARAIAVTGVDRAAAQVGAEIYDVDRRPSKEFAVPGGKVMSSVRLPADIEDFDVIVTMPKLKTHGLTRFTGGIKNLFGLIPGKGKKTAHVTAPGPDVFAELLSELASVVRPKFSIMDGVIAMEGNGPNAGTPRNMGLLGASSDFVALDAVACELIGYRSGSVPTVNLAGKRGLGVADMKSIQLHGGPLERFRVSDFKKPIGDRFGFLAQLLPARMFSRLIEDFVSCRSSVREERCRLCGECVRNCPAGAMEIQDGRVVVDGDKCIACYCCEEVCPYNAVVMVRTHFAGLCSAFAGFFTGRSQV